jgi:RNA-splicing ligase RtcB
MTEEIREKIADAQMVLVGIGKELEERFHGMEQDAGYVQLRAQAQEGEQRDVLEQYLRLAWLKDHTEKRSL